MSATLAKSVSSVLLVTFLSSVFSTAAVAQTMPPNAYMYGPANNKRLDYRYVEAIRVDPGKTLTVKFNFNAHFENAVCIYDVFGNKIAERGNYSRSSAPWMHRNNTNRAQWFTVTSWHKLGPPSSRLNWLGSRMKRFNSFSYPIVVGFEDHPASHKFDDVIVRYWQN